MGKIRVHDLAQKMKVPEQDLLFKLKSIGVRVEGQDDLIDTEVIQAILQGKKLPQPQREVILRDDSTAKPPAPTRRRTPPRRPAPGPPLRPQRRRAVVQKAEPRIKTLPSTERPQPAPPAEVAAARIVAEESAAAAPEEAARTPAAVTEAPAAERPATKKEAEAPARRPPVTEPPRERDKPSKHERERNKERRRRREVAVEEDELRTLRGPASDIAEEAEATVGEPAPAARRRRRVQRKKEQVAAAEEGRVLSFKRPEDVGAVTISEGMRVRDLAEKLGVKSKDLIQKLIARGIMANVNEILEPELAKEIAEDLGFEAMVLTFEEEVQLAQEGTQVGEGNVVRAPVVTIMGHVDHGKTSLLDTIRSSRVTESEFGGITQHIGAYRVELKDRPIVFLDTPGHEAFTALRARGAKVTNIVVLVVAADDGVMPQTVEAIDHARAAGVPLVVAINKIDKDNANPDRVKRDLADRGVLVEDWGGDTVSVPVSALKGEGIDHLLEMILLTADLLELKADPELPAQGVVIEARKTHGKGTMATVLVQNGTLHAADSFVSGSTFGRVRAMFDDLGQRLDVAGPATPVEVSGFQDLPEAGDTFQVVAEESKARQIAELRREEQRKRSLAPAGRRVSLDNLFEQIQKGEVKELPVVLKADVQGSVEVLRETLEKLSTDKVRVVVIRAGVGAITTHDVLLASASEALIYGFNVRPERNAVELADREEVEIRTHTVIYELNDELRKAMEGLLEPTYEEVERGRAEVREIFRVPRIGTVAGCHVVEGVIPRGARARLLRDNVVIHEGRIGSLRRFKEDASEVRSGFDCGIGLEQFQDVKPGDIIEAFVEEAVAPTL
jgi:translation initiation factor IF-2